MAKRYRGKRYRRPQTRHVVHENYKHYTDRTRDYKEGANSKEILAIFIIIISFVIIFFSIEIGVIILIVGAFWLYKLYKKGRKHILRQRAKYKGF